MSRIMGLTLLLALSGLQISHYAWLHLGQAWVTAWPYRMMLFAVAPAFFLFSQPLLRPQPLSPGGVHLGWHAVPSLVSPFMPAGWALPLAFIIGASYLSWLGRSLFQLRHERINFHREIVLLGGVFAIAVCVSILGLFEAAMPEKLFYSLYAISIGIAFLLVQITLNLRPGLSAEVGEAVRTAYASSTLGNVDCDSVLARLEALMKAERAYQDAELNLPGLADRLGLSSHQLSELINTRQGKGFSRYLREQRTEAAKIMLLAEPSASVLSVGLSVGFTSQSNFYEAFREIEGMTPGQYRKLNLKNSHPG